MKQKRSALVSLGKEQEAGGIKKTLAGRLFTVKNLILLFLLLAVPAGGASRSIWVWAEGKNFVTSQSEREEFLDFCQNTPGTVEPIKTVYFYPSTRPLMEETADFIALLRAFLKECHAKGIKVEYLDGEPLWISSKRGEAVKRIENFAAFQKGTRTAEERFDGIQLDVEPYTLPGWPSEQLRTSFLRFLDEAKSKLPSGTTLGVAIPYWYDDKFPDFLKETMRRVNYVAVMDYTDAAHEIIRFAEGEIEAGNSLGTKVVIGIETQDVVRMGEGQDLTTFHEEGNHVMEANLLKVSERFESERSYEGLAIHHYRSYRELIERTKDENKVPQERLKPVLLSLGEGNHSFPALSPNGTRLAFHSDMAGNDEVYVYSLDGRAPPVNLTKNSATDGFPCWSPNGKQIAFSSTRKGNGDIYIMNADGSNLRALTSTPAHEENPAWSPDGKQIVYFRRDEGGELDLWVQPAQGGEAQRLTRDAHFDYGPAWNPAGDEIVYASRRGGKTNLYRVNVATKAVQPMTNRATLDFMPAFSPDGTKLALSSDITGKSQIYVVDLKNGGKITRVTTDGFENTRPAWFPDGSRLVFQSDDGRSKKIRMVDFSGDQPGRPQGWITSPLSTEKIRGEVNIKGIVSSHRALADGAELSRLKSYSVRVRPKSAGEWKAVGKGTSPKEQETLAVWNTRQGFKNGEYVIQLKATDGLMDTISEIQVEVQN